MTEWEIALEAEKRFFTDAKIDPDSFLRGWQWGQRFEQYTRWFKTEYWADYIKGEAYERTDPRK